MINDESGSNATLFISRPEMCGEKTCSLQLRLVEETLLVFAVPMSWFYLMFFAGLVSALRGNVSDYISFTEPSN